MGAGKLSPNISNSLVINVLICCDYIGNSTVINGHLNGRMYTNNYLQAHAGVQNRKYKEDYAAVGTALAPAIVSVAKFIPGFFVSYGSRLTNRHAITTRSSAQRRRMTARLSRVVELLRLVLTRTLVARPSLMLLTHAYTSPQCN